MCLQYRWLSRVQTVDFVNIFSPGLRGSTEFERRLQRLCFYLFCLLAISRHTVTPAFAKETLGASSE